MAAVSDEQPGRREHKGVAAQREFRDQGGCAALQVDVEEAAILQVDPGLVRAQGGVPNLAWDLGVHAQT